MERERKQKGHRVEIQKAENKEVHRKMTEQRRKGQAEQKTEETEKEKDREKRGNRRDRRATKQLV